MNRQIDSGIFANKQANLNKNQLGGHFHNDNPIKTGFVRKMAYIKSNSRIDKLKL